MACMTVEPHSAGNTILYIGGHGKVALLATPKLVAAGYEVLSLVRNEAYVDELTQLGAQVIVADVTQVTVDEWVKLFADVDVVVWAAGNGGRAGADATLAIDRDGALTTIDALEKMQAEGIPAPKYIMVSYLGATLHEPSGDGTSWDAYVTAKKTVDERLNASSLDYVILGPSVLTEEPAEGIEIVPDDYDGAGSHTSRELVADVITELAGRAELPPSPLAFIDGTGPVSGIA